MDTNETAPTVRKSLFTLTLIWGALTVSVAVYALVLFILNQQGMLPMAPMDEATGPTLRLALLMMAATAGASVYTLPTFLLKPSTIRERLRSQGIDPVNLDGERLGLALFPQYQATLIVQCGAAETIGMMGLVMAMLIGLGPIAYGLLGASATA